MSGRQIAETSGPGGHRYRIGGTVGQDPCADDCPACARARPATAARYDTSAPPNPCELARVFIAREAAAAGFPRDQHGEYPPEARGALTTAARLFASLHGATTAAALEIIGSWTSSTPELAALQRVT